MTPTTEQIRQALQNTRQPSRTHGERVGDAISQKKKAGRTRLEVFLR